MDYVALNVESDGATHLNCTVRTPATQFLAEIPALGTHMVYPTLMAAALAEHFGMGADEITQGLRAFLPTKMRMNVCLLYTSKQISAEVQFEKTHRCNAGAISGDYQQSFWPFGRNTGSEITGEAS